MLNPPRRTGQRRKSMMNSSDERGEAAVATPRESGHSRQTRALFAALEALLQSTQDPFAIVLASLRDVVAFDRALVLEQIDADCFHCVAAVPRELAGRRWTAAEVAAAPSSDW